MTAKSSRSPGESIVLVGLMGAGKTSVGRSLADKLNLSFIDADEEIVKAAGCSIPDIFEMYGEKAFRDVEKRVIFRLLEEGKQIIATGGGAFMNADIRQNIAEKGISLWLRAELDVLVERTSRRGGRPLLENGEPREILRGLIDERYPVYAEADIIVDSKAVTIEETVDDTDKALAEFIAHNPGTENR